MLMKKTLSLLIIIFVILLSSCTSSEINIGFTMDGLQAPKTTQAYLAMSIENPQVDIDDSVKMTLFYGHDGLTDTQGITYNYFLIKVVIVDSTTREMTTIYELSFEGSTFLDAENICNIDRLSPGSKIEFNKSISLSIDFSLYDTSEGKLHYIIEESFTGENTINGNVVYETYVDNESIGVKYEIKNSVVTISRY